MIGRAAGWLGNLRAGAEDGREKGRKEAEGARGHNAKKTTRMLPRLPSFQCVTIPFILLV